MCLHNFEPLNMSKVSDVNRYDLGNRYGYKITFKHNQYLSSSFRYSPDLKKLEIGYYGSTGELHCLEYSLIKKKWNILSKDIELVTEQFLESTLILFKEVEAMFLLAGDVDFLYLDE